MATQKVKEKLFRVTPDDDARIDYLIQYAYKSGHIAKPTFQEFMQFAIQCTDSVLQEHYSEAGPTPHRRAII